jgi:hypothetical protein
MLVTAVKYFADTHCEISIAPEQGWHGNPVIQDRLKSHPVRKNTNRFWPEAGEKRRSGWIAHGIITIGIIKKNSLFCQAVHIGGMNQWMPVATQSIIKIINNDENHIRGLLHRFITAGTEG